MVEGDGPFYFQSGLDLAGIRTADFVSATSSYLCPSLPDEPNVDVQPGASTGSSGRTVRQDHDLYGCFSGSCCHLGHGRRAGRVDPGSRPGRCLTGSARCRSPSRVRAPGRAGDLSIFDAAGPGGSPDPARAHRRALGSAAWRLRPPPVKRTAGMLSGLGIAAALLRRPICSPWGNPRVRPTA